MRQLLAFQLLATLKLVLYYLLLITYLTCNHLIAIGTAIAQRQATFLKKNKTKSPYVFLHKDLNLFINIDIINLIKFFKIHGMYVEYIFG